VAVLVCKNFPEQTVFCAIATARKLPASEAGAVSTPAQTTITEQHGDFVAPIGRQRELVAADFASSITSSCTSVARCTISMMNAAVTAPRDLASAPADSARIVGRKCFPRHSGRIAHRE